MHPSNLLKLARRKQCFHLRLYPVTHNTQKMKVLQAVHLFCEVQLGISLSDTKKGFITNPSRSHNICQTNLDEADSKS